MSKIDIVNRLKNSLVWLERDGFLTSAKNALDAVSEINELRAENARLAAEVEQLKNVISLSEDSRLMDEHIKLERDHERQAERIAELEAQLVIEKGQLDLRDEENRILFTKSEAQSAVINALPEEAEQEVKSN